MAGVLGTLLPSAGSGNDTGGPPIGQGAMSGMTKPSGPLPMQQRPQPSYGQTRAAMHRFEAVRNALMPILKDKKIGRESVKKEIMSAGATLLGQQVLSMAEVMNEIKNLPDQPADQQLWLQKMIDNTRQAEMAVMDHYQQAGGDWAADSQMAKWSPESYSSDLKGLMKHYG